MNQHVIAHPAGEASLVVELEPHSAHLIFSPIPKSAGQVSIRFASIVDGKAMSGDGWDYRPGVTEVSLHAFDASKVDITSLGVEHAINVNDGMSVTAVLTWNTVGTGITVAALGITLAYFTSRGFSVVKTIADDEAVEYLKESGMWTEASSPPSLGSEGEEDLETKSFTNLIVSGYRGFAETRTLELAVPNGTLGSGLTVLVGANNSGKSTFLEAVHEIARARNLSELSFAQPRRHRENDSVRLELQRSDGRSLVVESVRPGGSQAQATWLPSDAGPDFFDIQVTPSRRQFSPYFGRTGVADRNWALVGQELSRTELREQFVGRLIRVERDPESRIAFDALLTEIIGARLNWTIDEIATGQQFLKLIESDGAWHTSEGLGDGLVSLLFIVDALYDSEKGSLIAIDEPELSLHPQLVRRLVKVLCRFAKDRQILVATHSPLLIEWSAIANGARIARVFKREGKSEISQVDPALLLEIAKLADTRNLRNPHTVGTVAREAFFLEDGVLLLEGQDDVAYLPRILSDLKLEEMDNVYGWGAGGVGNIPLLAELFVQLGFTRIAALVDSDGQAATRTVIEKLEFMGPEVLVRAIPAPDIRYKSASAAKEEVLGLLERDNRTVRSELRTETISVLSEVAEHLAES